MLLPQMHRLPKAQLWQLASLSQSSSKMQGSIIRARPPDRRSSSCTSAASCCSRLSSGSSGCSAL